MVLKAPKVSEKKADLEMGPGRNVEIFTTKNGAYYVEKMGDKFTKVYGKLDKNGEKVCCEQFRGDKKDVKYTVTDIAPKEADILKEANETANLRTFEGKIYRVETDEKKRVKGIICEVRPNGELQVNPAKVKGLVTGMNTA